MFRVVVQGVNLGLLIAGEITSEVLKAKLDQLQKDLDQLQQDLAKVGVDLKSGADFFRAIALSAKDLNFSFAEMDVITNKKILPVVSNIIRDGTTLFESLTHVPNPNAPSSPNEPDWSKALTWITRVVTVFAIAFTGKEFFTGLRRLLSPKDRAKMLPDQKGIEMTEVRSKIAGVVEEVGKDAGVNPIEEPLKVGEKPLPEASTRMETVGKVMDGVFFILSVVGLVLNIVSFKQAEAQLEKAIDDIQGEIVKAKEAAKQLTADEATFFRDIPSFYLSIFSQIQRVVGIAGLAQIIQSPQVHADKLTPILTKVSGFHPFSDDEMSFMNQIVSQLDAAELITNQEEKIKKMQSIFGDLEKRLPQSRFVDAFKKTADLYSTLKDLLNAAFDNFDTVSKMISAVKLVRVLIATIPPSAMQILKLSVGAVVGTMDVSESEILSIIAVYTTFAGDTYPPSYDLKSIRSQYTPIQLQELNDYVNQQIEEEKKEVAAEAATTGRTAAPSQPTQPAKPTAPTIPVTPPKPAEPTTPSKPAEPAKPTAPTIPVTPPKPAEPTTPSKPAEPAKPTAPTIPVTPPKPAEPTTPSKPAEPAKPTPPTIPVTPSKPAEPEKPAAPTIPVIPKPTEPAKPTAPAIPVTPSKPAEPAKPTAPAISATPPTPSGGTARFLRLQIDATRHSHPPQLSEVKFFSNGTPITPKSAVSPYPPQSPYDTEYAHNLIDGNVNTKWCTGQNSGLESKIPLDFNRDQVYVTFEFNQPVDLSTLTFQFVTANDVPARDPVAWTWLYGNDGNSWNFASHRCQDAPDARYAAYNQMSVLEGYRFLKIRINSTVGGVPPQLSEITFQNLTKPLSATSLYPPNSPGNLLDGKDSTKWSSSGQDSGLDSKTPVNFVTTPIEVIFDLGHIADVKSASYALKTANDTPARDPSSWTWYGSVDGTSWQFLSYNSVTPPANRLTSYGQSEFLKGVQFLKLRITGTKNSYPPQLSEIVFFDGPNVIHPKSANSLYPPNAPGSSEYAMNLLDGSEKTKWCSAQNSGLNSKIPVNFGENIVEVAFDMGGKGFYQNTTYAFKTANDYPQRDPTSWTWYASADGKDYSVISFKVWASLPPSRFSTYDRYSIWSFLG